MIMGWLQANTLTPSFLDPIKNCPIEFNEAILSDGGYKISVEGARVLSHEAMITKFSRLASRELTFSCTRYPLCQVR